MHAYTQINYGYYLIQHLLSAYVPISIVVIEAILTLSPPVEHCIIVPLRLEVAVAVNVERSGAMKVLAKMKTFEFISTEITDTACTDEITPLLDVSSGTDMIHCNVAACDAVHVSSSFSPGQA